MPFSWETLRNPQLLRSTRPAQFLQLEQVAGLLLPALDATVPDRIPGQVKQKKPHQPSLQGRINVCVRISESLEEASNATRHSCGHEGARTKQVVFAPSGHHVAEVDKA